MKRIMSVLLCLSLLLTTACAREPENTPSTAPQTEPTQTTPAAEETTMERHPNRKPVDPALITYADSYSFAELEHGNTETVEFSCLLEAENGQLGDGNYITTEVAGYSGEGYLDITDNTACSWTVELPASQFYKITVCHRAWSHKENPLLFNGEKAMDIISEDGEWVQTTVDGVFLEKGTNTLTLGAGWSWFSMDYIRIENGTPLNEGIYENVCATLSNPYANLKTQNIYQYLKAVYGKRTLTGQCTNYGTNTETDALFMGYGKYPAVRTFDFIYDSMSFCNNLPKATDVKLAIEWSKDGGLIVFDWHWYAPHKECAFYTKETTFTLANAVTEEKLAQLDFADVQALYREGKISMEALALIKDIDNISALMQRMEDENVTVMWRPMHEASGGWFWWGASGPDAYLWLWRLMYERMTDYHGLDNLIWVWNGQHADWYPGDDYCDIVSIDIYNGAHDYSASPSMLTQVASWANNGKLVALSECATMPDPELIVRDRAYWLWFAVWNWDFIVVNGTTELSDAYTSFEMMEKVYNSEVMLTRDELPSFE